MHEVISSVLNDTPEMPSSRCSQRIPALLESVAMKCLQKDPYARFQSMDELLMLLQQDWRSDLVSS